MSVTLLDLVCITGLSPLGADVATNSVNTSTSFHQLLDSDLSYGTFLNKYFKKEGEVTDEEYTAFLLYWLCKFLFCHPVIRVSKDFLYIASALAIGTKLAFDKTALALLYRGLAYTASVTYVGVLGVFGDPL